MTGNAKKRWRTARKPSQDSCLRHLALLLLLPSVAMQFTDQVSWDETDFIVAGAMLAVACGSFELVARMRSDTLYRAATGVAVAAAFILVWINLPLASPRPRTIPRT
jgi:hypothetical protein